MISPRERSILTVACYGHFVSHFNMLVFPAVLLPLSAQFGMDMVQTLALSFWMYLLFGITALPWGLLGDKIGSRPLFAVFHMGAGTCGFLAAINLSNPFLFGLSLSGIGLFSGIYHPVGLGWIAKEVKKTSRGMAINGMFGNLGLAAAPLLAGSLNYFYGIQAVYIVVGLVNCSGLVLLYIARNGHAGETITITQGKSKRVLAPFLVLLVAMMLGGIIYRSISLTLPAYFELQNQDLYDSFIAMAGKFGSPNVFATVITSTIYLVGMLGQYFGGWVGEKVDLGRGYLLFHLITIPAAIGMAMTTDIPLIVLAMIHSFFLLGMQPLENTLVAHLSPPKLFSTAYGLKFVLTFGVGALSVGMVAGIKESFGFSAVYLVLAGVSSVLVGVIVLLNYCRKKHRNEQG